jgi:hypothetical protein
MTYSGNPANYPASYPVLADYVVPTASIIDTPLEALGDRTAWLKKKTALERALNFPTAVNAPIGAGDRVKWDPTTRTWYACGSQDFFVGTKDPYKWPTATAITAGALFAAGSTYDFDISPAGVIVVTDINATPTLFQDTYHERTAAGVWTKQSANVGIGQYLPTVRYDVSSGLWCIACRNENNKSVAITTPDPHTPPTWTQHFIPSIPDTSDLTIGSNGANALVIQGTLGTTVYFSKSSDGGVTWSTAVPKALGFTATFPGSHPRPMWNGTHWLAFASDPSTTKTKVWTSTDGVTWTEVFSSVASGFQSVGFVDELWLALVKDGLSVALAVSTDKGVTWNFLDREFAFSSPNALPSYVASNANRFLLTGVNSVFWPGLAQGAALGVVP